MNEKYERIIEVSLKLFNEVGIHNTPTSKIAKEANVATGTLFHHFKTKEDIINAVYMDSKESLIGSIQKDLSDNDNLVEAAKKMFLASVRWGVNNPMRFRFFRTYGNSIFISNKTKENELAKFDFLLTLIENGQKQGFFKQLPAELLFNALYGLVTQFMNFFSENPDRISNENDIENAFTMIWDTLKR